MTDPGPNEARAAVAVAHRLRLALLLIAAFIGLAAVAVWFRDFTATYVLLGAGLIVCGALRWEAGTDMLKAYEADAVSNRRK